jgi:VPDSG-CTERM motif
MITFDAKPHFSWFPIGNLLTFLHYPCAPSTPMVHVRSSSCAHACARRVFRNSNESAAAKITSRVLLGLFLLCATVRASTIELNLGPSNNRIYDQLIVPFSQGIATLNGQTLSIDFTFVGDSFVHLYGSTSSTFSVQPMLELHGTGTIMDVVGSAYTFDSLHQQNSPLWSFGGGSVTADNETFNFGLGYVFPLLNPDGTPRDGVGAFDFYGAHFDFVLPDAPDFDVLGAQFGLFANGTKRHDYFAVWPHVPDSGSTLALLALVLAGLWISHKRKEQRSIVES